MVFFECPVCSTPCKNEPRENWCDIDCLRCGRFRADNSSLEALSNLSVKSDPDKTAIISGWINGHQGELLRKDVLVFILKRKPPIVADKADKLLRFLAALMPIPGSRAGFAPDFVQPLLQSSRSKAAIAGQFELNTGEVEQIRLPLRLLGVSWSRDFREVGFLVHQFLIRERGLLSGDNSMQITPSGWAFLDAPPHSDSNVAFVAMWFSEAMQLAWVNAIYPGILQAGYKPFRIDRHEHNNRIDDEIIASIRKSKFLIADFTGQRGGVYFEAGFALGLGLPVVWLCQESELEKIHFDNRQYNFVTWMEGEWESLQRGLQLRIEATIGRGSYTE